MRSKVHLKWHIRAVHYKLSMNLEGKVMVWLTWWRLWSRWSTRSRVSRTRTRFSSVNSAQNPLLSTNWKSNFTSFSTMRLTWSKFKSWLAKSSAQKWSWGRWKSVAITTAERKNRSSLKSMRCKRITRPFFPRSQACRNKAMQHVRRMRLLNFS